MGCTLAEQHVMQQLPRHMLAHDSGFSRKRRSPRCAEARFLHANVRNPGSFDEPKKHFHFNNMVMGKPSIAGRSRTCAPVGHRGRGIRSAKSLYRILCKRLTT